MRCLRSRSPCPVLACPIVVAADKGCHRPIGQLFLMSRRSVDAPADGVTRTTSRPAVCVLTSRPGLLSAACVVESAPPPLGAPVVTLPLRRRNGIALASADHHVELDDERYGWLHAASDDASVG